MFPLLMSALMVLAPQEAAPAKAPKTPKKPARKVQKAVQPETPAMPEGVRAVVTHAQDAQKKVYADLKAWTAAGNPPKTFKADLSAALAKLAEQKAAATDPEVKQACLLAELFLNGRVLLQKPSDELLAAIKAEVTPTSWGWSVEPGLMTWYAHRQIKDRAGLEALLVPAGEKHPDADVRVNARFAWWRENFQEVDEAADQALAGLKKEFPTHSLTLQAVKSVAQEALTAPGKKAPAFSLKALEGEETYTLESFKGKYVLVDFWATWCPYCVAEVPGLHKAFEAYKEKGLEILSLSCDRKVEDIAPYRAKGNPMPWKHAFLPEGTKGDTAKAYGVTGIPKPVLVGPDGVIVASGTSLRGEKLMETLAKVLK